MITRREWCKLSGAAALAGAGLCAAPELGFSRPPAGAEPSLLTGPSLNDPRDNLRGWRRLGLRPCPSEELRRAGGRLRLAIPAEVRLSPADCAALRACLERGAAVAWEAPALAGDSSLSAAWACLGGVRASRPQHLYRAPAADPNPPQIAPLAAARECSAEVRQRRDQAGDSRHSAGRVAAGKQRQSGARRGAVRGGGQPGGGAYTEVREQARLAEPGSPARSCALGWGNEAMGPLSPRPPRPFALGAHSPCDCEASPYLRLSCGSRFWWMRHDSEALFLVPLNGATGEPVVTFSDSDPSRTGAIVGWARRLGAGRIACIGTRLGAPADRNDTAAAAFLRAWLTQD